MTFHTPLQRRPGRWRSRAGGLVVVGLVATLAVDWAAGQIGVRDLGRETDAIHDEAAAGIYLPTDRLLSRAMNRAQERLEAREYHQALNFLQQVLERDEDVFLEMPPGDGGNGGLKATARRLIGQLPREGQEAYERLHATTARRRLDAVLAAGDKEGVAQVVRQYFHTSAGYEAALVLAQMEADLGHHLAAAQLYQELLDTPRAAERLEPQLSMLAAVNRMVAGQSQQADELLESLAERYGASSLKLAGEETAVPDIQRNGLSSLYERAGRPRPTDRRDLAWTTHRGDAGRNVERGGGAPHLRARWEARVVNDPGIESFVAARREQFRPRGVVTVPAARPVAVGDVVLFRAPQNVVAVDWQTGKRVWETREEEGLGPEELVTQLTTGNDEEEWPLPNHPLEQRVWDDALAMSLSSDGERFFVIRGLPLSTPDEMVTWNMAPGFGGAFGQATPVTNQLAAYELATEGKLVWEVDGQRTDGELAGAFFLGSPLAIEKSLFVLAEIRSSVYLVALDPRTGKLQWQQQLVGLEQGVSLDPVRRAAGATPSYAGGILVCPTAAGVTVGIDVVRRELAWIYQYGRAAPSPRELRNLWQQQMQRQNFRSNDRWLDSSAIVAEGRVLLTPPESADLHCVDLATGELVWKHRRGDALWIGCVDRGVVLLIGSESVEAVRMEDGAPAWQQESVALPSGSWPAGLGYLSGGRYYLPLTSGQLASIEVASGQIARPYTEPGPELGNLICFRGAVLSQSALVLDKFEQVEVLQQRAAAALAENPDDATAIRELAELARVDGNLTEAIELLLRANELAPGDPLVEEMLSESLLDALGTDYAKWHHHVPLVRRLIRRPEQEIELLRIAARGLDQLGQRLEALEAYLDLVEFSADEPVFLRIDEHHSARSDRWISGSLLALWSSAGPDERRAIRARIDALRPAADEEVATQALRHYLAHYGALPGADEVRGALARKYLDQERLQEAELVLLEQGARSEELTDLSADGSSPAGVRWPRGKVAVEVVPTAPSRRDRASRLRQQRQLSLRRLRIEQVFAGPALGGSAGFPADWFITADCSQLVGRDSSGEDVSQLEITRQGVARQLRIDSSYAHGARLGHLLFLSLGGQLVAVDARPEVNNGDGQVLWQAFPLGRFSTARGATAGARRHPLYHAWSGRRRMSGPSGPTWGSLGPVTPGGVVFQENEELRCVEPLTGEVLWTRSDLPAGCELFGDREVVLAADVANQMLYIVRMIDGRLLDRRSLPAIPWLATAGPNVVRLADRAEGGRRAGRGTRSLSVVDATSDEVLFEREYASDARMTVIEPRSVGVYEPSGQFQLIDVETGDVLIDQQLEREPRGRPPLRVQSIHAVASGDQLLLLVSSQPLGQQHRPIVLSEFPLVNGLVYAMRLKTGELLWPGPAVVRNRGIAVAQPPDVPLWVFVDRTSVRNAGGGSSQLRLLCLDKQTGQTVYRNDNLPDTAGGHVRIRVEPDASHTVSVEMSTREVRLAPTDEPRPPQPPANDDIETARENSSRGLWGSIERLGDELQKALEAPRGAQPDEPPAEEEPILDVGGE